MESKVLFLQNKVEFQQDQIDFLEQKVNKLEKMFFKFFPSKAEVAETIEDYPIEINSDSTILSSDDEDEADTLVELEHVEKISNNENLAVNSDDESQSDPLVKFEQVEKIPNKENLVKLWPFIGCNAETPPAEEVFCSSEGTWETVSEDLDCESMVTNFSEVSLPKTDHSKAIAEKEKPVDDQQKKVEEQVAEINPKSILKKDKSIKKKFANNLC